MWYSLALVDQQLILLEISGQITKTGQMKIIKTSSDLHLSSLVECVCCSRLRNPVWSSPVVVHPPENLFQMFWDAFLVRTKREVIRVSVTVLVNLLITAFPSTDLMLTGCFLFFAPLGEIYWLVCREIAEHQRFLNDSKPIAMPRYVGLRVKLSASICMILYTAPPPQIYPRSMHRNHLKSNL